MDAVALRASAEHLLAEEGLAWEYNGSVMALSCEREKQKSNEEIGRLAAEACLAAGDTGPALKLHARAASSLLPEAAREAARRLEMEGRTMAAYNCYKLAAGAGESDGELWFDMARLLINEYSLVSSQPRDASFYTVALEHLERAGELGYPQAQVVEEVLRGFWRINVDRK